MSFDLVSNLFFKVVFWATVIPWVLFGVSYVITRKVKKCYYGLGDEPVPCVFFIIACIFTIILISFVLVGFADKLIFDKNEEIYYQEVVTTHDTLISIINNSYDLVNSPIYEKIVDYNVRVTKIQHAYTNPNYTFMFNHSKCDWLNIPLIVIDENGAS